MTHILKSRHTITKFSKKSDRLLSMATAAQCHSPHPIARALAKASSSIKSRQAKPLSCEASIGRGVRTRFKGYRVTVGNVAMMAESGIALASELVERAGELEARGSTALLVARNKTVQG